MNDDFATPGNSLPPCRQFAVLVEFDDRLSECAVCERLEITHTRNGQRAITVAQADAEREAMIMTSAAEMIGPPFGFGAA